MLLLSIKIKRELRGEHHGECMNMKSTCPTCKSEMKRHELRRHMTKVHDIPSDLVNWSMWWK
eukprot:UN16929